MLTRAHPRVCGENAASEGPVDTGRGSSPRVRGKRVGSAAAIRLRGLIPACAGKTQRGSQGRLERPAHPRVCGENKLRNPVIPKDMGSSPRVRGKPNQQGLGSPPCGLIPACAGKTAQAQAWAETITAHPRVCGENRCLGAPEFTHEGSSPRVRGKRIYGIITALVPRLIPACAGKTRHLSVRWYRAWAHPRVCGENQVPRPR